GVASVVSAAIVIVAAPAISRATDPHAKIETWGRLLKLSICLQLVSAAALWLAAPYVVQLCFRASFAAATPAARILIVASVPLGANVLLAAGFRAFNRQLVPTAAELVSLTSTVAGLALLLVRFGPEGAAWSSLAAYSFTCLFLLS